MGKNLDREGGLLPHLKIVMGNPELASYSRNHFRTQPREGYKVEIFEKLWESFALINKKRQQRGLAR